MLRPFLRWLLALLTPDRMPPTAPVLEAAIPHLAYEQAALRASASNPSHRFTFEAFLIHARVLRSFYLDQWSDRNQWAESTIVAELYFPSANEWRSVKGSKPHPALTRTKDAIDKQLAHLTPERAATFLALESEVTDVQKELDDLWELLLKTLSNHRDVAPFRSALVQKCQELGCP